MEEQQQKKKDPIWKHAKIGTPLYRNPEHLWNDALLYFEWCDNNPVDAPINIIRYKKEKHGGSKEMKKQDQQENVSRPYTLYGFCAFTGIPRWGKFKEEYMQKMGYEDVIFAIENVIASQQLDGALTGVFKENLTARLNGLADKQQAEINGDLEVNNNHKFVGFNFLPATDGLPNSPKPIEADVVDVISEPEKEPEKVFAEIIDTPIWENKK